MNDRCENCGNVREYSYSRPIDDDLARTWGLSPSMRARFNMREGASCKKCGANKRAQGLAKAMISSAKYGYGASSLKDWVEKANERNLKVCELNSCQELHKTLVGLNNLTYAEYGTDSEQDIENLSYPDNTFDLVLHSETLEHVSEPAKAMDECRRVIKDGGLIFFTTPILWSRRTRKRASKQNGTINKDLPASYHAQQTDDYLVFYEYGHDIDKLLGCEVIYTDRANQNYVFCSGKRPGNIPVATKLTARLFEIIPVRRNS